MLDFQSQFLVDFSEAQSARWAEDLGAGRAMIALAITEPDAGSDMAQLSARAGLRGDRWRINGVDLGCRAAPCGILRMDDVELPAGAMVGPPGTAFIRISRFFDVNRAIIGLKCIGAALQSVTETVEYANKREVFGRPLSANQGVTFPLAEGVTFLDHARLGCYRVLWMRQNGIPCRHEGAMLKWWAPRTAAATS